MMRSYFILGMCLLFLVQYFVESQEVAYLLACFAVIAFFSSVTLAKPTPRFFSVLMFLAGVLFTIRKGDGLEAAVHGITANLPLLTLLVLVPLLSIPLKMGGFFDSILLYLKRVEHHPKKLFAGITTVLFFLGPILNIGAIRIVHELIQSLRLNSTFLSKAYLVGFFSTILWSPYYAAVGLTLMYLHVSVTDYMSYGFGIAILFLIVGNILFGFWVKDQDLGNKGRSSEPIPQDQWKKIQLLGVILAVLMVTTIFLEFVTHWSMLVIVSLVAMIFPLLWGVYSRQWEKIRQHFIDYRDKSVPIMNNEIIMYISAGFFGQSLKGTSFGKGISELMTNLSEISFLLLALFILLTMISVTFVGIHQVVIVTVLATQMNPQLLGTSKEILAMVIMLSWATSSVLSPVNPINLLVSGLVKKSSIDVGLRDNGRYLLVVCTIGMAILSFLH